MAADKTDTASPYRIDPRDQEIVDLKLKLSDSEQVSKGLREEMRALAATRARDEDRHQDELRHARKGRFTRMFARGMMMAFTLAWFAVSLVAVVGSVVAVAGYGWRPEILLVALAGVVSFVVFYGHLTDLAANG